MHLYIPEFWLGALALFGAEILAMIIFGAVSAGKKRKAKK